MTEREGVVKFRVDWREGPAPGGIGTLNEWRQKLFDLSLIGCGPDGIGYGNISVRDGEGFIISGSGTGCLPALTAAHYTRVFNYDFERNTLTCVGPITASSESLTHAAAYEGSGAVNAVMHVHSGRLWNGLIDKVPTTAREIEYGTPEMAFAVKRLVASLPACSVIVMGGHQDGLLVTGGDLDGAGKLLNKLVER